MVGHQRAAQEGEADALRRHIGGIHIRADDAEFRATPSVQQNHIAERHLFAIVRALQPAAEDALLASCRGEGQGEREFEHFLTFQPVNLQL